MSVFIESLSVSASPILEQFLWPMLWQSSLLIGVVFLMDSSLRRRLRPAIHYGFWLVLLLKLVLPPSLALPTGLAWWLRPAAAPAGGNGTRSVVVTYGPPVTPGLPISSASPQMTSPRPPLPASAWALIVSGGVSVLLLGVMLARWRQVSRMVSAALVAPATLEHLLDEARYRTGVRKQVKLKLTANAVSPSLCGFFRPVILLPRSLTEVLPDNQLQAVLVHELIHLRRRDVWVNALQAVLQVLYWWHPLLWLANARIRQLREQAVDDAVMVALRDEANTYAPTLLEVAKFALARPLSSLGLVGIFESRTALRERILRLENFRRPRNPGLTWTTGCGIVAFALTALPMGNSPTRLAEPPFSLRAGASEWPDPRFSGYSNLQLEARFFLMDDSSVRTLDLRTGSDFSVLTSNELAMLQARLGPTGAQEVPATGQVQLQAFSGGNFTWIIGGQTNNGINYQTRSTGSRIVVTGTEARFMEDQPGWVPLELNVIPWREDDSIHCEVALRRAFGKPALRWRNAVLPSNGGMIWVERDGMPTGKSQVVILRNAQAEAAAPPAGRSFPHTNTLLVSSNGPLAIYTRVIKVDPTAASDPTNFARVARLDSDADTSHRLVQQGKVLFEAGKLNDAETMLREAVQRNPKNQAAYYYLNLVVEARDKARRNQDDGAVRLQHPFLVQTNPFPGTLNRRQVINRKLDAIRFGSVSYDHLPLYELIDKLNDQVRSLDPEKRGVDFALSSVGRSGGTRDKSAPATGAPLAANPTDGVDDIGQIPISILPPLTDVRVLDVLDAVVKAASRPIKYSIEDSGVVFSAKRANEPAPLYVRIIKVDPERLSNGLALARQADSPPRDPKDLTSALRNFFTKQGVTLEAPKAVFFNDRDDTLVVRATRQELATIETAISALNDVFTPDVLIKARFFEAPSMVTALLWLDLGLKNPSQQSLTRILTPAQTDDFLRTITSDTNVDLLTESRIETRPGRQTEMQVVDAKTVVMGIDPRALSPPGIPAGGVPYLTTNMTFGPILDIVPYMATNGLEIEITATAFLTEFLGYDKPDQEVPIYVGRGGPIKGTLPLPRFRVRKMATPERLPVRNGWSVLLGNPVLENGRPEEDDASIRKDIFVLITPTLVDPTGTPIKK